MVKHPGILSRYLSQIGRSCQGDATPQVDLIKKGVVSGCVGVLFSGRVFFFQKRGSGVIFG